MEQQQVSYSVGHYIGRRRIVLMRFKSYSDAYKIMADILNYCDTHRAIAPRLDIVRELF